MAHVPAERCLSIIELLADGAREMPLGEIAERLDLPKSGAHRLLATLVGLGWAEQDDDTSFYRLTMRLAVLASTAMVLQLLLPTAVARAQEARMVAAVTVDGERVRLEMARFTSCRRRPPGKPLQTTRSVGAADRELPEEPRPAEREAVASERRVSR